MSEELKPCAIEAAIDAYLGNYIMEGDDGFHQPSDAELFYIKDAVMGLLEDADFCAAWNRRAPAQPDPAAHDDPANSYARGLAIALHARHFHEVTQWKPFDDTLGLLTQIDNMTCRLVQPAAAPTPEQVQALAVMTADAEKLGLYEAAPRVPNPDEVICPACTHQFRAIPENVQAELYAVRSAAPAVVEPRADGAPSSADERQLRRLLAHRVHMPHAYYDDGEAQGTEHGIQIDFMRDPVADIDAKLRALNVARHECAHPPEAPAVVEPTPRAPLTLDNIIDATIHIEKTEPGFVVAIARAIERAHGIGAEGGR